jgi:hypothetical protein
LHVSGLGNPLANSFMRSLFVSLMHSISCRWIENQLHEFIVICNSSVFLSNIVLYQTRLCLSAFFRYVSAAPSMLWLTDWLIIHLSCVFHPHRDETIASEGLQHFVTVNVLLCVNDCHNTRTLFLRSYTKGPWFWLLMPSARRRSHRYLFWCLWYNAAMAQTRLEPTTVQLQSTRSTTEQLFDLHFRWL